MSQDPLIVTIKRHSLEDGPGIRSVVFFKGCPLRCVFCHNLEAQKRGPEIGFSADRCLHCADCARACPRAAVDMSFPGRIRRNRCLACGACAAACPTGSLRLIGERFPVDQLVQVLLRDLPYYRHSGGGVTLSGGEPTLYPEFVSRLLSALKKAGVHTCLETCGHYDHRVFSRRILPHLDLVFFDLKLIDPDRHRQYTGKGNRTILRNLARLQAERPGFVQVRVPFIPDITTTPENLAGIRNFLSRIGIGAVTFLPYNPLAIDARVRLGREPVPLSHSLMTTAEEDRALSVFLSAQKGERNGSDRCSGRLCGEPALD